MNIVVPNVQRMAVVALLFGLGCVPDLKVPQKANLTCDADRDCPGTLSCAVEIHRCVKKADDLTPPKVEALSVDTPVLAVGHTVSISLRVSEPLAELPAVVVQWPGARAASAEAVHVAGAKDGSEYIFSYTATGLESEAFADVTVSVVDTSGLTAQAIYTRQFLFDFSGPTLASLVIFSRDDGNFRAAASENQIYLDRTRFDGQPGLPHVIMTFSVSEDLGEPPTIHVSGSDGVATRDPLASKGLFYWFDFAPTGSESDGAATVTADLTDLVGNSAQVALGTITFDSVGPSLTQGEVDQILYRRIPWGDDSHATPTWEVTIPGGLFEDGVEVSILGTPSLLTPQLLASAFLELGSDPLAFTLEPQDRLHVFVALRDRAGNPHGPTALEINHGEWVASLRREAGSGVLDNPHLADATRQASSTSVLDEDYLASADDVDGTALAATDQALVAVEAAPPELGQRVADPFRFDAHSMVFAPELGGLILWGERQNLSLTGGVTLASLYRWDSQRWTRIFDATPTGVGPVLRFGSPLAYDAGNQRLLIFGGRDASGAYRNDTWEWDGGQWRDVTPASGNPPARAEHVLVYDPARGNTILFGGRVEVGNGGACGDGRIADSSGVCYFNDTWEWAAGAWQPVTTTGSDGDPSARRGAAATTDSNGNIVLFGGESSGQGCLADTQITTCSNYVPCNCQDLWSLVGDAWMRIFRPADEAVTPTPAGMGSAATNPKDGSLIVYAAASADWLWRWDGLAWQVLSPAGSEAPASPAGARVEVAYDEAHTQLVYLQEGSTTTFAFDEQSWSSHTWSCGLGNQCDAPAGIASLVDDPDQGGVLAVRDRGGCTLSGCNFVNDEIFWLWTGSGWRNLPQVQVPASCGTQLVYDAALGEVLGVTTTNLVTFDARAGDCVHVANLPASRAPSTAGLATAYDSTNGTLMVHGLATGGGTGSETWTYDADGVWTMVCDGSTCSAPTIQNSLFAIAHMAFDPVSGTTMLFAGSGVGFYLWSGSGWNAVVPDTSGSHVDPGSVYTGGMLLWDAATQRIAMSRATALLQPSEIFFWDGTGWLPTAGEDHLHDGTPNILGAYDSRNEAILFVSGSDTWLLHTDQHLRRPALRTLFDWSAASLPADTINSLTVSFVAGGNSLDASSMALFGVDLQVFDPLLGRWRSLGANDAATNAPATVEANETTAASGLVDGTTHTLLFRVLPKGQSGDEPARARLAVDYAELRVGYSLF